jgi:uncharacterized protein YbjT (DUF2867 family)
MILVTGATGSTGSEVIKRLAGSGADIRAMVRKIPRGMYTPSGVEFVAGDFDSSASVRRALEGVDRAFLVTNSSERVEAQQLGFVEEARGAGVRHIVYLSQLHAAADSPVRFLRYHAAVEDAIAASGIAFTHLRPNLFMQGLLGVRSSIVSQGRFFAPAGDARVSVVDVRDIAVVAAAALMQNGHEGKTYDLTGPEALTHSEMASYLTVVSGKRVEFVNICDDVMRDALLGFGFPEWQADGLVEDYQHYRRGEASAVSSSVHEVTGCPPRSFAVFAVDFRKAFSS